jgi:hypothetical protein
MRFIRTYVYIELWMLLIGKATSHTYVHLCPHRNILITYAYTLADLTTEEAEENKAKLDVAEQRRKVTEAYKNWAKEEWGTATKRVERARRRVRVVLVFI